MRKIKLHVSSNRLSDNQLDIIAQRLHTICINKQYADDTDLERAAVLFYNLCEFGYLITDEIIGRITTELYSEETINELKELANTATIFHGGLNANPKTRHIITVEELDEE